MENEMQKGDDKASGLPGIGGGSEGGGDAAYWRKRAEDAERQAQSARVDSGRVSALARENNALKAENERLKEKGAVDALPDDLKDSVPEDIAKAAAIIARREVESGRSLIDQSLAAHSAEMSRMSERMMDDQIDSAFPGFRVSISAGGNLADAWARYLSVFRPSVEAAYASRNIVAMRRIILQFYGEAGVPAPGGGAPSAAEPTQVRGGDAAGKAYTGDKRVYTMAEYEAENERIRIGLRNGSVSREEYARIDAELEAAAFEGRVVSA